MNHWIVTDGAAGNQRQAQALADALDLKTTPLIADLKAPWSILAPRWIGALKHALTGAQAHRLRLPPPRLVIGCGRQAAAVTRWLRQRGQGRCQAIQILDPGVDPRHWDLVIAPAHDQLNGPNVLSPMTSLHPVDPQWLAEGRRIWAALARWPSPRIGVLLGGPRRAMPMDVAELASLFQDLGHMLQRDGGSILLLCSRRTPDAVRAWAKDFVERHDGLCWTGIEDGDNPYQGVLAWADRLVVTPDSVNMLSEACATGLPVYCPRPATPLPPRLARFMRALEAHDLLRELEDRRPAIAWRETAALAVEVRQRLGLPPTTRLDA